ncbi:MAG: hypothetical protein NTY20_05060 [Candidatus Aenigmarchaeota archaeon]|nr:hypothetical protein [Candidatus Aenigmarchaeota archaeon]
MAESGWKEVKTKMWARIKEIEKLIPSYDYSEKHYMISTDEKMTDLVHDELRKSKKILFNIIENSYEQQKEGLTTDLQKIRDDIDIFLDGVKIKHVKWPETIPEEFLEKIVIHDSELLREIPRLNSELEEIEKQLLVMEKPGTSLFDREQLDKLNARTLAIKNRVAELVRLFKERELLLNLKHVHREHEYEELREGMETKF